MPEPTSLDPHEDLGHRCRHRDGPSDRATLLVGSILAARRRRDRRRRGLEPPGNQRVRWHIDPIDGTVNYVHGIPGFCVSIAAEMAGQVVAGVVVSPATISPADSAATDTEKPGRPWT